MNRPYCMDKHSQSAYSNLSPSYSVLCPLFMPLSIKSGRQLHLHGPVRPLYKILPGAFILEDNYSVTGASNIFHMWK